MELMKKIRFWRGLGQITNSKVVAPIVQAMRKPSNWGLSLRVSTNNDTIPWTPFKEPLNESCLAVVSTAGFYLEGDEPDASAHQLAKKLKADNVDYVLMVPA